MIRAFRTTVTAERLREALAYDRETGIFTWKVRPNRRIRLGSKAGADSMGYAVIKLDGYIYRANRLAWLYVRGRWPQWDIDHINGVTSDDSFANLRDVSKTVNQQNQRRPQKHNKTGFLGVSLTQYGYCAQISADGEHHFLGHFETPEEAHSAYLKAKRELHDGCTI